MRSIETTQKRRLFLSILEGETTGDARPLIASEDAALIRIVANELARRLGADGETPQILRFDPEAHLPRP